MNIGNKIKQYRELNKMTQKDIAEVLGVEPGTISKYESGMIEPNIESIKKLAETFKITIDELLKDEEKFDVSKVDVLKALREQKEMKLKGNLYHQTQVSFAYNTNHIEGSTLTEDQTRYIFETNTIVVENEVLNVDDVIETANHFRCIDMIIDNAKAALSKKFIKELHLILKFGTSDSRKDWFAVGDYKKMPNEVGGMTTVFMENVADKMKVLLIEYNSIENKSFEDIL